MKNLILLIGMVIFSMNLYAQEQADTSWRSDYRETAPRINNLVHTRLAVEFDFPKSYLYGKAWITLKPHFYPTDSLTLDAKGMDIKKVAIVRGSATAPLKYEYDGMQLRVKLDKNYTRKDSYTIYIDYTAKPDEFKAVGSAAITDAKGLYFIDPRNEDPAKPTQIWTQGETEATSVWCPTIDKPNQKTTQEIAMTVPAKFVTLSNGKLASQKKNANGTRTDTWKMELPHAPYLFFMGAGEFAVVKDSYKGKEVSYYVEKEYEPVARKIFGNTPEMMSFFSKLIGVEYPWNKYAQFVGRDYVSGAMENTTATIHQETAQQDARQLVDGNIWENTIAHELFHQWFGDLVTSESWSNLTLNESFANYSEYLWQEYKYGADAALEHHFNEMNGYLQSNSEKKNLVRYYYNDKEAMFDAVSYNKGGRILHMLRDYVGDSAFFSALNLYLVKNKFATAEAHQLRLAFEEITGQDLNWFWNQWYFGSGHPKLSIDYVYDNNVKQVKVIIKQLQEQKVFRLPVAVDVYNGAQKVRHNVWIDNRIDTLTFAYTSMPDLVNVDAEKMLLAEKTDNKTLANYIHQYKYAGNYLDRREAVDFAAESQDPAAFEFLKTAVKDKYAGIRAFTLNRLDWREAKVRTEMEPMLADMAANDPKKNVKALAMTILGSYGKPEYRDLFAANVNDSSYSVAGAALDGLVLVDSSAAINEAKKIAQGNMKGRLVESVTRVRMLTGDPEAFDDALQTFDQMPFSQSKFNLVQPLSQMLEKISDTEKFKKGVDLLVEFRNQIPAEYGVTTYINNLLNAAASKIQVNEHADYIRTKMAAK